ncbi:Signal transduction histidine-protein kinase AtoS [Desulfosarcina cetonica]|uniref:sensor histidine kinase n=1 Tax=Desulfosarcina cetonica TaxID=90730 RepID=UPI0006CF6019|nr:PAS domain-containing sensor histidine kinase [Desulfosarcina cetonica]VTR71158.1 Signal transduction histidine-protein kinase AtoS [Desulfosarcina cetonica]
MKSSKKKADIEQKQESYGYLFRKFTFLTVVCSVVPLLLVGWGLNAYYTYYSKSRTIGNFKNQVENHRRFVEEFLKEQSSKLRLLTYTHSKAFLLAPGHLQVVFENMNREYQSITDIGVIDHNGRHLAYVGPYPLLDKNYADAEWFKEVMTKGLYISDMFMGFRQEPHFIIAVSRLEGNEEWILRATVNTDVFRTLVENVRIGESGEVYLVNSQGIYQTSPRFGGKIMESSPVKIEDFTESVKVTIYNDNPNGSGFSNQIVGKAWLDPPGWLLVIKQDYSEAFAEINHSRRTNLIFLFICAISILIISLFITRYMVGIIRHRDERANQLNAQLLQTGKLASIGELAAGVAHEINNPLAIISTERQILIDQFQNSHIDDEAFKDQFSTSMDQIAIQSKRCKRITQNLLRFSRRTHSMIEDVDLNQFIFEVVDLMEREAKSSGVKFITDLDDRLPTLRSDASQLQQVFLNLITNAIDAHEGKPYGSIRISTTYEEDQTGVTIKVADTGSGISDEDLNRIFDPFFTKKPVGKGTGLGLSICHTIIQNLGGKITVNSKKNEGTEFAIFLPLITSLPEPEDNGEETA